MGLERLSIRGFRNLSPTELTPSPGINWFFGDNGAGKTSVLEALYVLGRGRSFRAARIAPLIQHGQTSLQVVARCRSDGLRLGIERTPNDWRGRIAGADSRKISQFAAALPLVLIEPDSHRLVDGGPDRRRSYLDWQLFHVEHDYLKSWQRYARLLRQRNAALKARSGLATLSALEAPMVNAAEVVNSRRQDQVAKLQSMIKLLLNRLSFRLPGEIVLSYRPGHPADRPLAEGWQEQRDSDIERGFTQRGPHRAELTISCAGHPAAVEMSRGQQKLLAVTLSLAQLMILDQHGTRPPLLLLDDPVSELDRRHLGVLLDWLKEQRFQSWITATEPASEADGMFHVEHGRVEQSS